MKGHEVLGLIVDAFDDIDLPIGLAAYEQVLAKGNRAM